MTDSYYRDRINQALIAAENARAARMAALSEAIHAVLRHDQEVMDEDEFDLIGEASSVVDRLHMIW